MSLYKTDLQFHYLHFVLFMLSLFFFLFCNYMIYFSNKQLLVLKNKSCIILVFKMQINIVLAVILKYVPAICFWKKFSFIIIFWLNLLHIFFCELITGLTFKGTTVSFLAYLFSFSFVHILYEISMFLLLDRLKLLISLCKGT